MKLGHAALIHCGQVVYICVSKLTIFGSDNGLLPGQCQAIICTSGGVLLIRPLWTKFNEILWEIHIFSLTEGWFTMNLHCDDDIFAWFFFHYTGNFYAFIVRTPVDFGEEEKFILKCCVENCIHFFLCLNVVVNGVQQSHYTMMNSHQNASWWRHQMETFSVLLVLCVGNSPVPGEFPAQRPMMWSFDVFFDLRPNKWLSKQSWGWWFEMQLRSLWRHCNAQLTSYSLNMMACYSRFSRNRHLGVPYFRLFSERGVVPCEADRRHSAHWKYMAAAKSTLQIQCSRRKNWRPQHCI